MKIHFPHIYVIASLREAFKLHEAPSNENIAKADHRQWWAVNESFSPLAENTQENKSDESSFNISCNSKLHIHTCFQLYVNLYMFWSSGQIFTSARCKFDHQWDDCSLKEKYGINCFVHYCKPLELLIMLPVFIYLRNLHVKKKIVEGASFQH